jgi:tetratricopeptide (TPR) repeat protein
MARKKRFRPDVETIEIERNIVERLLMQAKAYVKSNRKVVAGVLIGLLVVIVIVTGLLFALDMVTTRNQRRFEKIMNDYVKYSPAGEKEKMKSVIRELEEFIDSTYFGFTHDMGYYMLGNIYYEEKDYKKAEQYYRKFSQKASPSIFIPLALLKAAIACEEMNDLKCALEIYKKLENDYSDSVVADQIFYNYARLCGKMNDIFNSKKYYNKVIKSFPDSSYVNQSRKRLFMLGTR